MTQLPPLPRRVARGLLEPLLLAALPAAAKLTVMHGYADYTSALLWRMADTAGPIAVSWQPDGRSTERQLTLDATPSSGNVVLARLTGLFPGKAVAYRVTGYGDSHAGTLTTQPFWSKAAGARDLAIAFGSCFFPADSDPVWGGQEYGGGFGIFDAIAAMKPDLLLWTGDKSCFQKPDEFDPAAMAQRYQRQRTFPPLRKLLTAAPHLAI
jgi:alkaline phosphatase D